MKGEIVEVYTEESRSGRIVTNGCRVCGRIDKLMVCIVTEHGLCSSDNKVEYRCRYHSSPKLWQTYENQIKMEANKQNRRLKELRNRALEYIEYGVTDIRYSDCGKFIIIEVENKLF